MSEGVTRLVGDHVELAKAELAEAGRKAARGSAALVAGGLMLVLAWMSFAASVGLWVAERTGAPRAFLLVAALHTVVAVVLGSPALRRLRAPGRTLESTRTELRQDRAFIGELRRTGLKGRREAAR